MIVGAIVLYDASPIPTKPRKNRNHLKSFTNDPKKVVVDHITTPIIIIERREYRSPK